MTTGATGQLGLALPVQGELSGTWGDTVNNGITQYTNIAIAATLTLTNDGAVTLANTTGDASASNIVSTLTGAGTVTAQFAIVRVTGTLTTAKVITAPSYSKTYVVVNAATGGIVTFKASGQTGVSIAVGESAWVYYNGTDYVKIAGTTSGSAGGSNTQVQYNSSGVLAGSSALTFDGTTLSLTGVQTITNSSGSTLTLDRTSNPGSLQFNFGGTQTGQIQAVSGGGLVFYQGSSPTEGMRLTSTGLGIGTSNPQRKIDAQSTTADYQLRLGYNSSFYYDIGRVNSNGYLGFYGSQTNATGFTFGGVDGTWATISSTGNLGIGTTSPAQKLDVSGSGTVSGRVSSTTGNATFILNSASGFYNYLSYTSAGSSGLILYDTTNSANRVVLDSAGSLIVGSTSPMAVSASTRGQVSINGSSDSIVAFGVANTYTAYAYTSASILNIGTVTNIPFTFTTNSAERMRIDSSGNVGIGTTSPQFGIDLRRGSGANAYLLAAGNNNGTTAGLLVGQDTTGLSLIWQYGANPITFWTNSTERTRISATGGFSVGTTADPGVGAIYATGNITAYYSDARLKTVSGKIENALDKVAQLSGVYYTNNSVAKSFGYDSDEVQVGVLAQDVEAVLPEIVKAAPFDLDEHGHSKSGENYKTVQYERLVPLLIEAINELRAEVKALKGA